jgi:hypothetical protein
MSDGHHPDDIKTLNHFHEAMLTDTCRADSFRTFKPLAKVIKMDVWSGESQNDAVCFSWKKKTG